MFEAILLLWTLVDASSLLPGCDRECILGRLYAPSIEEAIADSNLSRLPSAFPPSASIFESLLDRGEALLVPKSNDDKLLVLGGDGRLAFYAALLGWRVMAQPEAPSLSRSFLALRRLRDVLQNFGDDKVDRDETCTDQAARGECARNEEVALRCGRSCYNRTQWSSLRWQDSEVELIQGPVNMSEVTLAVIEDRPGGPNRAKEMAMMTAQLEAQLMPGALVWSLDPLELKGAEVQEMDSSQKPQRVPAGGLVFLQRLHLKTSWAPDVPCQLYIKVPPPPPPLRPRWPLSPQEARRLHQAAKEELVRLGALRLSGAVLSARRFALAFPKGARLARAFGAPAALLGTQPDFCHCRPRDAGYEVGAVQLLGMFLLAVHSSQPCAVPPCTASDGLLALAIAEQRRQLLSGTESDVPVELLRDFACLRFTGQRTLLHAAVGRKDLPLARAVLRSQGLGGLWCRDAEGQSALHHAAQPAAHGNASGTVQWLLPQMRQHAKEMLQARDHRGRSALLTVGDVDTLRLLRPDVPDTPDFADRDLLWHAVALQRTDLVAEICTKSPLRNASSSPLVAAARRVLQCGAATETLKVMASCTGREVNGSLEDFAALVCREG